MLFELSLKLMNFDLRAMDLLKLIAAPLLLERRNEAIGLDFHLGFIY